MKRRSAIAALAAVVVTLAAIGLAYRYWSGSPADPVADILGRLPSDASDVIFIDLTALRQSPFLAELYKWAPASATDADYQQFLGSTGFNYESDLNRVGIAILHRGQETTLFALADGHFDQKKISAYALQTGTRESRNGHEIFSVPVSGNPRRVVFTFPRNDRIALTNGPDLDTRTLQSAADSDASAWGERFRRLAGSPVFAVIRQDPGRDSLRDHAPSGFSSPQLAALLNQLQWITVAGKPDAAFLRVVLEGEGPPQTNTRQLADVVNGLLLLAQAGLSDPKVRQQLPPQVRQAYLDVLKSADVSQIDRGETKSVRLMFDVTPDFLEAARSAMPAAPAAKTSKSFSNKSTIRN